VDDAGVSERFQNQMSQIGTFGTSPSVLYELAAPSFPAAEAQALVGGKTNVPTPSGPVPLSEATVRKPVKTCNRNCHCEPGKNLSKLDLGLNAWGAPALGLECPVAAPVGACA